VGQISSIGDNWVSLLLVIGIMGVYQVDRIYAVMSGIGGEEILGSLVESSRGVVGEVLWENVAGRVVFVDTWGGGHYVLIGSREVIVWYVHLGVETHCYLMNFPSSNLGDETIEIGCGGGGVGCLVGGGLCRFKWNKVGGWR